MRMNEGHAATMDQQTRDLLCHLSRDEQQLLRALMEARCTNYREAFEWGRYIMAEGMSPDEAAKRVKLTMPGLFEMADDEALRPVTPKPLTYALDPDSTRNNTPSRWWYRLATLVVYAGLLALGVLLATLLI